MFRDTAEDAAILALRKVAKYLEEALVGKTVDRRRCNSVGLKAGDGVRSADASSLSWRAVDGTQPGHVDLVRAEGSEFIVTCSFPNNQEV